MLQARVARHSIPIESAAGLLFLVLLCGGCAVQGPAYEEAAAPPAKSVVYLYRPYNYGFGAGVSPSISCGANSITLHAGGFKKLVIDPQKLTCTASTESISMVEIDGQPGQEYYIRESMGLGVTLAHPHLVLEDKATAQAEIRDCKEQQ